VNNKAVIRIIALAIMTLTLCQLFAVSAFAVTEVPYPKTSRSAILYCITSGDILWEKNPDVRVYPASTVKIMTAIIALEHYAGAYDTNITIDASCIKNTSGNRIKLREGEVVTADQLINALIVGGANDAAQALAVNIAGSTAAFVDMMNEKAKAIGMENTYYANPTGLHNGTMYTTASDVMTLALYAKNIGRFMDICGVARYDMEATNISKVRNIVNKNYFVSPNSGYYYSVVDGMNSGSTPEAGYCTVATAIQDGVSYLCIVMGAGVQEDIVKEAETITHEDGTIEEITPAEVKRTVLSYGECRALINWALKNYGYLTVAGASDLVWEMPVNLSSSVDHVTLVPKHEIELYLPTDIDMETEIRRTWTLDSESIDAPIKAGTKVGVLTLTYEGEKVAEVELVTRNNVERDEWLYIFNQISEASKTPGFRLCAIALIIAVVAYIYGTSIARARRKKAEEREYYKNKPF